MVWPSIPQLGAALRTFQAPELRVELAEASVATVSRFGFSFAQSYFLHPPEMLIPRAVPNTLPVRECLPRSQLLGSFIYDTVPSSAHVRNNLLKREENTS